MKKKGNDCVQIKLSVTIFEDEIKTYDELILSLLTKKRNGIADYKSSAIFWRHVMQIRRGKDVYKLEKNSAPNKDLLMLSLALAMDDNVYNLLIQKKYNLPKENFPVCTFNILTSVKMKKKYLSNDFNMLENILEQQ